MRIVVTGGAGFIGYHVVKSLVAVGHDVEVVDLRLGRDFRLWVPEGGVVYDAVVNLAALGGVALAARAPTAVIENNVGVAARIVALKDSFRRIVHASSFSIYGPNAPIPTNTAAPIDPAEAYGASKAMQELCLRGLDHATVLRFSSVYGSGMRLDDSEATIVARIAGWVARGEPVKIFEDGLQTRDFVHVDDVVAAIEKALVAPPTTLNVCSGVEVTLLDTVRCVASAMGREANVIVTGEKRAGDMRRCLGSAHPLAHFIGRQPIQFKEGARRAFGS